MKKADKKKLLITNLCYWAAAVIVPPMLYLIPTSQTPKILPLFIYLFMLMLAVFSTLMWSKVLDGCTNEDS